MFLKIILFYHERDMIVPHLSHWKFHCMKLKLRWKIFPSIDQQPQILEKERKKIDKS